MVLLQLNEREAAAIKFWQVSIRLNKKLRKAVLTEVSQSNFSKKSLKFLGKPQ